MPINLRGKFAMRIFGNARKKSMRIFGNARKKSMRIFVLRITLDEKIHVVEYLSMRISILSLRIFVYENIRL